MRNPGSDRGSSRRLLVFACAVLLGLGGCTSAQLASFTDRNDPCSNERQPLLHAQDDFKTWTAGGTVIGALAGALIGGVASGDWKGAAAGGVAGGLLGGAGGYLAAKQQFENDQAALQASISQDAANDTQRVRELRRAVATLGACRERQAGTVVAEFKAGRLDQSAAMASLADIRTAASRDGELITVVTGAVADRVETYNTAQLQIAQTIHASTPTMGSIGAQDVSSEQAASVEATPVIKPTPPAAPEPRVAPPSTQVGDLADANEDLKREQQAVEKRIAAYEELVEEATI
jgi:hypothetical protein